MKRKLFIILALVLCMALMVGVLAACNEGGTTGTGGDDTQGDVTPGGGDEQGGNTPGGGDENQGGNTPGGNTPGGNPGGDFPWNPGGDDDDDTPGGDDEQGGNTPGGNIPGGNPGGDFPWNPGGDGDVIFTEDASLAEIIAALENAENFTCEANAINSTVSDGAIVSETNNIVQVSENAMYSVTETKSDGTISRYDYAIFTEGGVAFSIGTSGTEVDEREKDLLSNIDPLAIAEPHIDPLYYLLTEENGKIVIDPEVAIYYTDLHLRLEGDRLVIGFSRIYNNERAIIEHVWSKVNATGVIVPDELRELAYGAEWSDSVSYNGVNYQKSADGTYYYVSHNYTGVEPESYINTLPVRENEEVKRAAAWDAMLDDLDAVRADENEVKEFAFALEIAEKVEGDAADERIFSLVFDSVNEYIYGLAGKEGEFLKFNGFDLGHLALTVLDDWLGLYGESIMGLVPVTADGFKSDQMVGGILLGFVGEYANEGDAYMFEIDLLSIINFRACRYRCRAR